MTWIDTITLMRNEWSILIIFLLLLATEILLDDRRQPQLIPLAIGLFAVHTIGSFFPGKAGELFGGMYRTNDLLHFMKAILNTAVLIILFQSYHWVKTELAPHGRAGAFYLLLFAVLSGMYFLISSGDFIMFFIGFELSTLPVAALTAFHLKEIRSTEAGIKLILLAGLASGIMLYGISLMYAVTGNLYFADFLVNTDHETLLIFGLVLFLSGLAFKISLVPFHFWAPDVYEGAPIAVTSFLSVVSKAAAVFILLILLLSVLPELSEIWKMILYILSVLTMTVGNLFALRQTNMKRFLAFSSIAQAGFILLGILASEAVGASTVVYFILIYVFTNLAAFGVVQAIKDATGKEEMVDYTGLYRTNPRLSLVMVLALFSLAGIPPMAGFFGKFFLFLAAAGKGYYTLVLIAVINVTISLYYYLLPVRAMLLRTSDAPLAHIRSGSMMRIGLILCVVGILILGMYSPLYDYILSLTNEWLQ